MANIDQRVVTLKLDSSSFQKNANNAIKTIDKLTQSLSKLSSLKVNDTLNKSLSSANFSKLSKSAQDSFAQIDKASKNVKFQSLISNAGAAFSQISVKAGQTTLEGLANSVQAIGDKFNSLRLIAIGTLTNIASQAVSSGAQLAKSFTIEPIIDGFREYELQLNSVQTILANTASKGTNIDQVNAALNELNTYADQTIYNFSEMTRNIGTFTAAGVDLDKSVASIKGIANLAAMSGSSSQQASTAMYQLSQAIAAGKVQLMDWNSVVNAGMGGEAFQNALKRTAQHFGTDVDSMIKKYGSFRESLTKGEWLTTDVLTETLKQLSGAYSEADLVAQGYSEDQAKAIVDMAKTAEDAATKIKTFSQLMDTLKEEVGSGWATTWQILMGNFEEARDSWTAIGNQLQASIGQVSKARNDLLQGWANLGGRKELFDSLTDSLKMVASWITPIKQGFRDVFPPTTAQQLFDITKGLHQFIKDATLTSDQSERLRGVVKTLASGLKYLLDALNGAREGLSKMIGGVKGVINGLLSIFDGVAKLTQSLTGGTNAANAFNQAFSLVGSGLNGVAKILSLVGVGFSTLASAVGNSLGKISGGISNLTAGTGQILSSIVTMFQSVFGALPTLLNSVTNGIGNIFNNAFKNIPFKDILATVNEVIKTIMMWNINGIIQGWKKNAKDAQNIADKIQDIVDSFKSIPENITKVLDKTKDSISAFTMSIKANILLKIAAAIAVLAVSLKLLSNIPLDKLASSLGMLAGGMAVFGGMALGFIIALDKLFKGAKRMAKLMVLVQQFGKMAKALVIFAAAIRILADAMTVFGDMGWGQIFKGVVAIGALSGVLVAVSKLMSGTKGMAKTSMMLIVFAAAIKILGSALKDIGSLDFNIIAKGLLGIGTSTAIMIVAMKSLNKGMSKLVKSGIMMLTFAISMKTMASAIKSFEGIDVKTIAKSLGALGATMLILSIYTNKMKSANIKTAATSVASLMLYAEALKQMGEAIAAFNDISIEGVGKAILGIGALLTEFVLFTKLAKADKIGETGAALAAMGAAVQQFAKGVEIMAKLSWEELGKGIVGVGAGLTIMVSAMRFMPKNMLKESAGMVVFSLALNVMANALKEIGSMSVEQLAKGIFALGGALSVMVIAFKALDSTKGSTTKLAASMLLFGISLSMIAGPIKMLGEMRTKQVAQGLIAMASAFAVISVAAKLLSGMTGQMLKLAGSMAAIGAATIVLGLGLTAMIYPIEKLAGLGSEGLAQGVGGLVAVIGTVAVLIQSINMMPKLNLKAVASIAIMAIVIAGVGAIVKQLAQLQPGAALQAATGLSEVLLSASASLAILSKINVSGAAVAVAALGVLIAGAAAIVAAAGALAQIPGAKWLMGEGQAFLLQIGQAIGGFFGGIVGGVVGGVMSTIAGQLPAMGSALSDFFNNAKPFFDGMSGMGTGVLDGVKNLALAMVALTGAELLQGITNFLTGGGSSIGKFGQQIAELGPYLKKFGESVKGLDAGSVEAAANAAKALAEFAKNIPNEGGWAAKIMGENDIAAFGMKLIPFGTCIKMFSDEVKGLDAGAVEAAASAAKALAAFAKNIPNEGGWAAKIMGENDIAAFGKKLVPFGKAIKEYATAVKGVDGSVIQSSANSAKAISEFAKNIPNSGGLGTLFTGDNDIAVFASKLGPFGTAMSDFAKNLGKKFKPETVTAAANAAKAIAELANNLPNSGGLKQAFSGIKDLGGFAGNLKGLGTGIKDYANSVKDIKPEMADSIRNSANAMLAIADLQKALPKIGGFGDVFSGVQDFSTFNTQLKPLGEAIKDYADSVKDFNPETVSLIQNSINVLTEFGKLQSALPAVGGVAQAFNGTHDFSVMGSQLGSLGDALEDYVGSITTAMTPDIVPLIQSSINCLNALGGLLNSLPAIGGIAQFFNGHQDFSVLSGGLTGLGSAMYDYVTSISTAMTVDTVPVIQGSIACLNALGFLLNSLPPVGAIGDWFTGHQDFSVLSNGLSSLGDAMYEYVTSVATAMTMDTVPVIQASIACLNAFGGLLNTLPNVGGINSWFQGQKDFSSLSNGLPSLGSALSSYASSVSSITPDTVTSIEASVKAVEAMAKIQNSLSETGGVAGWWNGDKGNAFEGLANQMQSVSKAVAALAKTGVNMENVNAAINAVNRIKSMANNLAGFNGAGIQAFKQSMENVGDLGLGKFSKSISTAATSAVTSLSQFGKNISSQTSSVRSVFDGIRSTISSSASSMSTGITTAIATMTLSVNTGVSSLLMAMQAMSAGITSSMMFTATTVTAGSMMVIAAFTMMNVGMSASLSGTSAMISGVMAGISAVIMAGAAMSSGAVQMLVITISSGMAQVASAMTSGSAGVSAGAAMIGTGLNLAVMSSAVATARINQNIQSGLQSAVASIRNYSGQFYNAGRTAIQGMVDGMRSGGSGARGAAQSVMRSALNAVHGYYNDFRSTGAYAVSGFTQGIEDNINNAANAAARMAQAASDAAKRNLKVHSPSRVFANIGRFVSLGFAKGVVDNTSVATDSVTKMSTSVIDAFSQAVSSLGDDINGNLDLSPTITPVLDLSAVSTDASKLTTMLDTTSPRIRASVIGAPSKTVRGSDPDSKNSDTSNSGPSLSFVQNNYSPKSLSRIDIYRDTKNQFSQLKGVLDKI